MLNVQLMIHVATLSDPRLFLEFNNFLYLIYFNLILLVTGCHCRIVRFDEHLEVVNAYRRQVSHPSEHGEQEMT